MTLILLTTCVITPLNIAFSMADSNSSIFYLNITIDLIFFIDIVVIFNSAYYTEDYECIDNRKRIALKISLRLVFH